MKDVAMAQRAHVHDVLARYGAAQRRSEYELLRDVTHWSADDVEREKAIAEGTTDIVPSCVLDHSFAELLQNFEFEAP
jgi:phosphoglycolate phosphatase